jgi:uncharacterized RDD family membrane protein YckC
MRSVVHQSQSGAYSPWWRRVLAELIDFAVVAVIASLLLLAIGEHSLWYPHSGHLTGKDIIARYVAVDLAALLYYPILMRYTDGQTIGKQLLRIRVVRADGYRMSLTRAAWRDFVIKFVVLDLVWLLPFLGSALGESVFVVNGLWPLLDRENRALHDMIAQTCVVRVAPAIGQDMPEIVGDVG